MRTTIIMLLAGFVGVLQAAEPGFSTIFNGKDLAGWEGEEGNWVVKDGAIQSVGGKTKRNWIIWRGGETKDFELRLEFKYTKGNSGVQVRSKELDDFLVCGYQVEVAAQNKMGLWHHSIAPEKYRSTLATAGQMVRIAADGTKTVQQIGKPEAVQAVYKEGAWNELTVIAKGPKLIQKINGLVFAQLIDEDAKHATRTGLLALQDHGKGTVAAFRNIRIKHFPAAE